LSREIEIDRVVFKRRNEQIKKEKDMLKQRWRWLIFLLVWGIGIGNGRGEEADEISQLMQMNLEEILNMKMVSAARHEQSVFDSPRAVSVISGEEIRRKNFRSTPEALLETTGILVQETNYGAGSPIIRGLIGNQILILVDGVRMNNAIYRFGPNQYLNTIDLNQIERIEVVRGAGSVPYGSDALGGVIHIITKSRTEFEEGFDLDGRLFGRYATADHGRTGRFELGGNSGNLGFLGGISLKKFGDLRGGKEVDLQPFTGYDEWDADLKLTYRLSEKQQVAVGYQHVVQTDVPRTDRLTAGSDLKSHWDPQQRDLIYAQYDLNGVNAFIDSLHLSLSHHIQKEEFDRIVTSNATRQREHEDKVKSLGAGVQLASSLGSRQLFTYGADYYSDDVASSRVDVNLTNGTETERNGNYADGATYKSTALFLQDEIKVADPLSLNLGVRYTSHQIKAEVNDATIGTIEIDSDPSAVTGNVYALYRAAEGVHLSVGVAQGFRAPNMDDVSIIGSFGSGFEVPNPDLDPEQSLNYEVGVKVQKPRYSSSLFFYMSDIKDLIQREAGTFNGLSFVDANGNGVQDTGEESVFRRQNVGEAKIEGIEAEGRFVMVQNWSLWGNVTWTKGENEETGDPLTRIPPLRGIVGVTWTPTERVWIEYYSFFADKQDRLSPSDKSDIRIGPDGTDGYVTYNLRGGVDLKLFGKATLAVENLSNKTYKLHGSGFAAPGLNLIAGYEWKF
jgi:TonB-dependent heme/hemoglobin receptor